MAGEVLQAPSPCAAHPVSPLPSEEAPPRYPVRVAMIVKVSLGRRAPWWRVLEVAHNGISRPEGPPSPAQPRGPTVELQSPQRAVPPQSRVEVWGRLSEMWVCGLSPLLGRQEGGRPRPGSSEQPLEGGHCAWSLVTKPAGAGCEAPSRLGRGSRASWMPALPPSCCGHEVVSLSLMAVTRARATKARPTLLAVRKTCEC